MHLAGCMRCPIYVAGRSAARHRGPRFEAAGPGLEYALRGNSVEIDLDIASGLC